MEKRSAVLMDAPPAKEAVGPFLSIAGILRDLHLSAPEVFAQDSEHGFLLLEDLGDDTYTRVFATSPDREEPLYMLAVDLSHARCIRVSNHPRMCRLMTMRG